MADDAPSITSRDLAAALSAIVGPDNVSRDEALCVLHSQDIWKKGAETVALVVSPGSIEELSSVVAAATGKGFAVAPRGAGMSYTGGYLPATPRTLSLDMTRMNRILAIRPDDMTVTVEAGCSWSALNDALKPLGLRTPFWGPMSGLVSTIGGGLSQLNAMLGAGRYGTSSESMIALSVVLADGSVLRTGARGPDGDHPFYRHYGPDLAGLFCGDNGVFGVKAHITLRLIRAPAHEAYTSFSFSTGGQLLEAMAEIARDGVASETCGFDPGLTKVRMARASLTSDVKTLGAVVARQKSLFRGLAEAAKVAVAGRNFVGADDYPLHVICENRSEAGLADDLARTRQIAADRGGAEIENTIAKVIRALPFPPLNSVLGPAGERWAPIHGITPLSQGPAVFEAIQAAYAELAPEFEREGVSTGFLFTHLSTNAVILEPVFYWPDACFDIHGVAIEPALMSRLPVQPENPAATALVAKARGRVLAIFQRFGCGHFQIGRTYPYRESRDQASWKVIEAVKAAVDPMGAFNPGALGLTRPAA